MKDDQIAAIISYVRHEWGNSPKQTLKPADLTALVKATREKIQTSGHTGAWTVQSLQGAEFTAPD